MKLVDLDLHEIEKKILLHLNDPEKHDDLFWGAAISVCCESLQGKGLITRGPRYELTPAGRDAVMLIKQEVPA